MIKTDDQLIAALLDGRLTGREREDALAALAASEKDGMVFDQSAAILAELAAEGIVQLPRGVTPRRWRVPVAIAALATAAAVIGIVGYARIRGNSANQRDDSVSSLVVLLDTPKHQLPGDWRGDAWPPTRGSGDVASPEAQAARIGVRLVDLSIALREGNAPNALLSARDLSSLVETLPLGGQLAVEFNAIVRDNGVAKGDAAARLAQVEADIRRATPAGFLTFGAWCESARVAAIQRDESFFTGPHGAAALSRAPTLAGISAPAVKSTLRLSALVQGPPFDWARVGAEVDTLVREVVR